MKEPRRTPRPPWKWVGGKTQLLPNLIATIDRITKDHPFTTYHEPFFGGGALFFELARLGRLKTARIADANTELVYALTAIRDDVEAVIRSLEHPTCFANTPEQHATVRTCDWRTLAPQVAAARLIYLNKTSFNGLYRLNRKGEFNAPFGKYPNPRICDPENLRACASALRSTEIVCTPFDAVRDVAVAGDLLYCDPPYLPATKTANFTSYTKDGFGQKDHERLADLFDRLSARGVAVILSMADNAWTRERYAGHEIVEVSAKRSVNRDGKKRGPVPELIIVGNPSRSRQFCDPKTPERDRRHTSLSALINRWAVDPA